MELISCSRTDFDAHGAEKSLQPFQRQVFIKKSTRPFPLSELLSVRTPTPELLAQKADCEENLNVCFCVQLCSNRTELIIVRRLQLLNQKVSSFGLLQVICSPPVHEWNRQAPYLYGV